MLSRRELIGKAAVGAAAALAIGGVGRAAASTRPLGATTDGPAGGDDGHDGAGALHEQPGLAPQSDTAVISTPPPWQLVAPFAAGSVVAHDWRLVDMTAVQDGSAVVTLQNARGRAERIHLCQNDGSPAGVIYTPRVDLVVMNQGYGELPTDEHLGRAVAALAHAVATNEATMPASLFGELLPHRERVQRFAAVEGPAADGKLR